MQKKIMVDIYSNVIEQSGKTSSGYAYDSLRLNYTSGHRIYYTGMKNGVPMQEVIKVMQLDNGKVYLSFGKNRIEIGSYMEVAA